LQRRRKRRGIDRACASSQRVCSVAFGDVAQRNVTAFLWVAAAGRLRLDCHPRKRIARPEWCEIDDERQEERREKGENLESITSSLDDVLAPLCAATESFGPRPCTNTRATMQG